jgi:hypothetical protein
MKSILFSFVTALGLFSSFAIASYEQKPVYYFTSPTGGTNNMGTVYQMKGSKRTVIYNFCSEDDCRDGATPLTGVVLMPDGSLIGTTSAGGSGLGGPAGVIYQLKRATNGLWQQTVLYNQCNYWGDCDHYGTPQGSLQLAAPNKLVGVSVTSDGTKGVHWSFVIGESGYAWQSIKFWKDKYEDVDSDDQNRLIKRVDIPRVN